MSKPVTAIAIAIAFAGSVAANAQIIPISAVSAASATSNWTYPDIADLYGASPIVLRAKIVSATALKDQAAGAGTKRFYVEGTVTTLIRGSQGVAPRLAWLVDVAPDSRNRLPRLKNADVLIAALPVAGRPGEIRLAGRDAQQPWSAPLEQRVRAVVAAAVAADAPPVVTGVASAFHSPGTIPGEGETQIFLTTADKSPVSLTVLRRPGQQPRWAFAQGEIVDEAAEPPAVDTLAWYRLACFLPVALPEATVQELSASDAEVARADYRFVLGQLGPCPRVRQK